MCSVLFSFLYVFSAFTGSVDGCINFFNNDGVRELSVKAFQHSISVMKCVSGRLVGGSYEGLVKVGECEYIDRFVSSITHTAGREYIERVANHAYLVCVLVRPHLILSYCYLTFLACMQYMSVY